jgi:hypothetical protein
MYHIILMTQARVCATSLPRDQQSVYSSLLLPQRACAHSCVEGSTINDSPAGVQPSCITLFDDLGHLVLHHWLLGETSCQYVVTVVTPQRVRTLPSEGSGSQ